MSRATLGRSEAAWSALLSAEIVAPKGPPAGGGWKTTAEIARLLSCADVTARGKMNRLVEAGGYEKARGSNPKSKQPCDYFRPIV